MTRYIVTAQAIPYNYNRPQSFVVEAETPQDAEALVSRRLGDLDPQRSLYGYPTYYTGPLSASHKLGSKYKVVEDTPVPAGRIIETR